MFLAHVVVPPFTARGLSGNTDEYADWRKKCGRLKTLGLHNKSIGCGASGAYALGPVERRRRRRTQLYELYEHYEFNRPLMLHVLSIFGPV